MATQSQLYSALVAVGIPADRARIGAAIAMAESGGNLTAHNAVAPDNSYGPWQINMIGALGPARRALYGLSTNEQLYDLPTSARVVKGISSNGSNWGPWSTYKSGSYKAFLGNTVANDPTGIHIPIPSLPGLSDITAPFQGFGKIIDGVSKTASWISNSSNWVRILYVTGGVVVIVVGLDMYLNSTGAGKSAMKVGANAARGAALLA